MRWSKSRVAVVVAVVVALFSVASQVGALVPDVRLLSDKTRVVYPSVITLTAEVASVTASTPTTAAFEFKTDDPGSAWVPIRTVSSMPGAPGRFVALSAPNPRNATYRARVGTFETAPVHVAVYVPMGKPIASKSIVKVGKPLGLTGTIRPFHPNSAVIRLDSQKRGSKGWPKASVSTTLAPTVAIDNDKSAWVRTVTPRKGDVGKWRVRSFHECPGHTASYSAWTYYSVVK